MKKFLVLIVSILTVLSTMHSMYRPTGDSFNQTYDALINDGAFDILLSQLKSGGIIYSELVSQLFTKAINNFGLSILYAEDFANLSWSKIKKSIKINSAESAELLKAFKTVQKLGQHLLDLAVVQSEQNNVKIMAIKSDVDRVKKTISKLEFINSNLSSGSKSRSSGDGFMGNIKSFLGF